MFERPTGEPLLSAAGRRLGASPSASASLARFALGKET
jgi:hypothetical protein